MARLKQSSGKILVVLTVFAVMAPGASARALEIPVSGRVRTPDGSPLSGARVELIALLDGYQSGKLELEGKAEAAPVATAVADGKGVFQLAAPEPGMWRVVVRAPGRVAMESRLIPLMEETDLPPVELAADQGLSVRVLGSDGKAVARARVRAPAGERIWTPGVFSWRPVRRLAWTDAQGLARLPWAVGEKARIQAFAPGALESGESLVSGGDATLSLGAARSLEVELVDAEGKALAAVLVSVGKGVWPLGIADARGRVTLPVPVEAALDLTVQVHGGLRETFELRATAEDLATAGAVKRVPLARPAVISGRVLRQPEKVPFPGALVWLAADPAAALRADAKGTYALTNNQTGPGSVLAAAPDYLLAGGGFEVDREARGEGALPDVELSPMGVVEGRVVDPEGRPLPEAEVEASRKPGEPELPFSSAWVGQTLTSATGRFRLRGLLAGTKYDLTARKEGFAPASIVVMTAPPRAVVPVEVVLKKGRILSGRIVDEEGRPVNGVDVRVNPGQKSVQTRESGTFDLLDLPGGIYDLSAYRQGFSPLVVPRVDFPEEKGFLDLGTLTLRKAAVLEGRVTDPNGKPIAGVQLGTTALVAVILEHASPDARKNQGFAVTDAEGRFRILGLQAGERINVFVRHPGYLALRLSVREAGEKPLEIVLRPGAGISGSVVDDQDEPVQGATVKILREPAPANLSDREGPPWDPTAFTDGSGRFRLHDLEPGTVRLATSKKDAGVADFVEVVLENGKELQDVVITLRREATPTIEGRVLDAQGRPVVGAAVSVFPDSPLVGHSRVTTDASGRFRLEGILPGPATVSAEDLEDFAQASQQIQVQRGRNQVDLILASGQPVSGRVLDETGQPISGLPVWLESMADRSLGTRRGSSAADGAFTLNRVPDGHYWVHAWRETGGSPWVRVDVAGRPVADVELRLQRFGRITGRILGAQPEDILWLKVGASRAEPPETREGLIDYEGRYAISSNLLPGVWEVKAWDSRSGRTAQGNVNLEPGSPEAILNLRFHGDLVLSGRVLRRDEPVAGVLVRLTGSRSTNWMTTDSFGGFRLEGLEPGSYRLEVRDPSGKALREQTVELSRNEEVVVPLE
jgi:protocatechuate 3,4-dioxygenase beta subunit